MENNVAQKNNLWFAVILIYLSAINFLVIKTTPEIIAVQFALLTLIYSKTRFSSFAKAWVPFIAVFLLYEVVRGVVDDISPFYKYTLFWIYRLENYIFPTLPSVFLQKHFPGNGIVLNFSLFFYTTLFYYSFLVGFLIWLKDEKLFIIYARRFLLLSFFGILIFFLMPTAPPWFVEKEFGIGLTRPLFENTILNSFGGITLYKYFVYGNPVAAFPSHHSAWPMYTSLFLIKNLKSKFRFLTLIIPLIIGFSIILTGEHYLLDVIAGYLIALFAVYTKHFYFFKKRQK